ncbi:MAG: complex I NDUFA9 subunit family protein [Planctomycetota bacterium]|nr:complex I NDUFA9 subunit family protein [Planctomycetota bacterium]MDP7129689.1 complex I NDUFA9 subunit family protein [Planctomycetota bacterium]MDP7251622.1 complex I NDUFA9 subunit family protein [Planctomycetota bacterium]
MNVFLTGATGFVGRHILPKLTEKGHSVKCLVRPGSESTLPDSGQVTPVPGNIHDFASLEQGMEGCDAVIHLVGVIGEVGQNTFFNAHTLGTQKVVDAMRAHGIRRLVHMSALGARPGANANYHKTKYDAEVYIKSNNTQTDLGQTPSASLDYTIFRPSVIHGPDGEFMQMLKEFVTGKFDPALKKIGIPLPFFPIPGEGAGLLQPVYVEELAQMFVNSLDKPETIGREFDLGGPRQYTLEEIVKQVAAAMGVKPRRGIHFPMWMMYLIATVMEILCPLCCGKKPALNTDQLIMMQEDNVCDSSEAEAVFGIKLTEMSETLNRYVEKIP